ncbi:zinc-ribbon domain-containing protein [Tateyamaria omphalii]|uniref:zinc-ribbon domain-containing protein n=1 Tax=Tateyamaria omphalii TaxID=299262 RepID=UPI001C99F7BA|nr:zinc-ribbon domain-containing protein [Tateyamaria omphalii]MBY5933831.1 zinc-ribbon domain-containing protein [Tateyamaria omphalii]
MRLICPNCDAQYEVVDDVIPAEGRDVQCSNCGQTWFQHHPDHMPEEPEAEDAPADLAAPDDSPTEDEERAAAPEPKRRELDPEVADILREEAEIESQARASEAEALESQPELGLSNAETDADRRAREARERMARMRGEDPTPEQVSEAAATAAAIGSRRDLLPDIEEINSTLRSTGDRQSPPAAEMAPDPAEMEQARSGFRRGFMLMILLAVVLLLIYVFAPDIAQAVPGVDPFLSSYVAQVDGARLWLDGQVSSGLTWLDNLTASEGE